MDTSSRRRTSTSTEPSLGWTWLSREALSRAKAQMDDESSGVRDEVGFLVIQQRYADHFFPGTSVLHARARYALFVPWLLEDLQGLTVTAAKRALRDREKEIAGRLREAKEHKVIGGRVHPRPASQPPSVVYWNALAVWGILRQGRNGRTLSRTEVLQRLSRMSATKDDDGQPLHGLDPPFIRLPERPREWRSGDLTLRLTASEADFLRDRLSRLRPKGCDQLSLLARLAGSPIRTPSSMWAQDIRAVAGPDKGALVQAERAASLACIGRSIYDALVQHLVGHQDKRISTEVYREHLQRALEAHGSTASQLDVDKLEDDIGALPPPLRIVLTETLNWMTKRATDVTSLLEVYTVAESRKGARARLALTPDGRARRLEWSADLHGFAGPLHYRWEQVRTLLDDLADAA
ncbi:DUF6361 family protein [Frateuria sp. GZRe12]|uniref:DUF6361 family protein n=1 Tax=Frateuria sp. GZRe12 TaxID=3351533 RepID=UPI003EDC0AD8